MNGCISEISAVAKQLGRMLESSSPVFQRDRLNEHIRSVVADNRKYTWNVTINPNEDNKYSTAEPDEDCAVIRLGDSASILSHPHIPVDETLSQPDICPKEADFPPDKPPD